ncbi:hypothetical protein BKI52_07435 [marine bacterium AO1-C]|nr:hypothetical protein BKI52_07435 [marine bacterium AO1-C]
MKKCFIRLFNLIIVFNLLLSAQAISKDRLATVVIYQKLAGNLTENLRGTLPNKKLLASNKPLTQVHQQRQEKPTNPDSSCNFPMVLQVAKGKGFFRAIKPTDTIQASYKDDVLAFRFVPYKNHLKLQNSKQEAIREAPDSTWGYSKASFPVTYYDLPPGIHEFRVAYPDGMGAEGSKEIKLIVIVHLPWWQTWWFRLSIIGLSGLAILGAYYLSKHNRVVRQNLPKKSANGPSTTNITQDKPRLNDENLTLLASRKEMPESKEEERSLLNQKLHEVVVGQKLYKEEDISLAKLAKKMQISERRLSELFNRELHTNFYDYINRCRVNAFKEQLKRSDTQHLKLIAIAYESGFHSKATFNRIFKKYTGLTPSQYKKTMEDTSDN